MLDALVASSFDLSALDPSDRAAGERVLSVLGLLDSTGPETVIGAEDRESLVSVTVARAARASSVADDASMLMPYDEEAVDALLASGFEVSGVPRALRARAERASGLLSLLDQSVGQAGESPSADLVERTLSYVQSNAESEASRMRLDRPARGGGWQMRMRDLVAIAAVLVIGTTVLWPMLSSVGAYAQRTHCAGSLATAGLGFGQYVGDYSDGWPMASSSQAGGYWWNVGSASESNSANIYTMVRTGYTDGGLDPLACGGNADAVYGDVPAGRMDWSRLEEVSYSSQNLFASVRPSATDPTVAVLSDRSPVVLLSFRHRAVNPYLNSPNHGGRGQNVLLGDGSVEWRTSPVDRNGDNLWLPARVEAFIARISDPGAVRPLSGRETTELTDDAFMVP